MALKEPRMYLAVRNFGAKAFQLLLSLYNQSWQIGGLEARWKIARIVAIR